MSRWIKQNGLTIALLALFLFAVIGQALTGWAAENAELARHGRPGQSLIAYLGGGAFLSALFENWESEFLQMWAYVMLTAYLFQKGSPESKDPEKKEVPQDHVPATSRVPRQAPWPVRRGGLALKFYSHSLGYALLGLFIASFLLHWVNSARKAAEEAIAHGAPPIAVLSYLADPEFWFESFQNWQSEFLSTAVLMVLGIWLRERGSPESKAVADPHGKTGAE